MKRRAFASSDMVLQAVEPDSFTSLGHDQPRLEVPAGMAAPFLMETALGRRVLLAGVPLRRRFWSATLISVSGVENFLPAGVVKITSLPCRRTKFASKVRPTELVQVPARETAADARNSAAIAAGSQDGKDRCGLNDYAGLIFNRL